MSTKLAETKQSESGLASCHTSNSLLLLLTMLGPAFTFIVMLLCYIFIIVSSHSIEDVLTFSSLVPLFVAIVIGSSLTWIKNATHVVPPGYRKVLMSILTGKISILESGSHIFYPKEIYRTLGSGPFRGISTRYESLCPAPGARLDIDPPEAMITTKDKIHGTVDVNAIAVILPWSSGTMIEASGQTFTKNASQSINKWICSVVGTLDADNVTFYTISNQLNSQKNLDSLNRALKDYHLKVVSVHLDPSAIKLSKVYTTQRDKINADLQILSAQERTCRKQMSLQKLREERSKREEEIKMGIARLQAKAKIEAAQAAKRVEIERSAANVERVKQLIAAGLSPHDVACLMVCEEAGKNIAKAKCSKIVAVPPSMLGLYGIQGLAKTMGMTHAPSKLNEGALSDGNSASWTKVSDHE
eukprot:g1311.t1